MPELPEVETLRRELDRAVKNKIIKSVEVRWPKLVKPLSANIFSKKLIGQKIISTDRRAKILLLKLSKGDKKTRDGFLAIHLKMTGQLIFRPKKGSLVIGGHPLPPPPNLPLGQGEGLNSNLPHKHTHIIINFTDGSTLYFNDIRKFGWLKIFDAKSLEKLSAEFGPEALSDQFNLKKFQEILKKYPNQKIKQLLTDQKLIAGIGNIYADESCFCAGIRPTRLVKDIKLSEINKLLLCFKKTLKLAISKGGTSSDTYVKLNGQPGGFVPYLKVYGRQGEKCKKCQGLVEKIRLNGRGTHFCRSCQK